MGTLDFKQVDRLKKQLFILHEDQKMKNIKTALGNIKNKLKHFQVSLVKCIDS